AIAIPAYQDYTIKSRISEGASLSGAFKTAIEVYWSETGTLAGFTDNDVNNALIGTTAVSGEYVSSILIQTEGTPARPQLEITLRSGTNKIGNEDGKCFRYVPAPTAGIGSNLRWTVENTAPICAAGGVNDKYKPKT
ncbi:MAG: pilin, partial [Cycloclasticus sp.]|nr:pilin [Cycloclasticus sp.]